MAGDDCVVPVDQDGIGKAKRLDAVGDLTDLVFGMSAGIVGVGFQFCDWQVTYRHFRNACFHESLFQRLFSGDEVPVLAK
jgi:hypothetical protein